MAMNGGRTWLGNLPLEIYLRIIELYIPRKGLFAVARTFKDAQDLGKFNVLSHAAFGPEPKANIVISNPRALSFCLFS
jgi:hypothetical protein